MREIDLINAKMNGKNVSIPQFLYKYRSFDEHVMDMLENEYVYLCPAMELDDPSECTVDFSLQDIIDLQTNRLTFQSVDMLLAFVKPYTSKSNFQQVRNIIYQSLTSDGVGPGPDLLEAYFAMQGLVPEEVFVPLINQLRNIPERLNDSDVRKQFEKLFALAYNARRDMGICSLSELKNSAEMWKNYADESRGYCIEYDMQQYENVYALFPVVYQDNRDNNILTNILSAFMGEIIFGISNGEIETDRSQFLRMFLTKDSRWSYQKEWRLLGDAGQKLHAPPVKAIYLGKNMSAQRKKQLTIFCESHNILIEGQR